MCGTQRAEQSRKPRCALSTSKFYLVCPSTEELSELELRGEERGENPEEESKGGQILVDAPPKCQLLFLRVLPIIFVSQRGRSALPGGSAGMVTEVPVSSQPGEKAHRGELLPHKALASSGRASLRHRAPARRVPTSQRTPHLPLAGRGGVGRQVLTLPTGLPTPTGSPGSAHD